MAAAAMFRSSLCFLSPESQQLSLSNPRTNLPPSVNIRASDPVVSRPPAHTHHRTSAAQNHNSTDDNPSRAARRYWNINLEELMEAGVHFGHGTRKWNPKMAPYISAKRKGIHIINLTATARFLSEACDLVFDAASEGKQFLIVGTNTKVADLVAEAATVARCHYVNKKWLGGMLTNWSTIETRLRKFRDLTTQQRAGRFSSLSKRDAANSKRQLSRLQAYLGGIKYMTRLPDVVIIVDQPKEFTALRECMILGIPTICLIDTNCDPALADIPIPANDDAISSIRLVLGKLVFAICEGRGRCVRQP